MALLEILNGPRTGERLRINGQKAVLGRHPQCDIVLDQGAISRQHAQISLVDGTVLHRRPEKPQRNVSERTMIQGSQPLHDGDELKICDMALAFRSEEPTSAAGKSGVDTDLFTVEDAKGGHHQQHRDVEARRFLGQLGSVRVAVESGNQTAGFGGDHAEPEPGHGAGANSAEGAG